MMTVAKADKNRLTIRGLIDGDRYVVREQPGGWFVFPEKKHRIKKSGMSAEQFKQLHQSRAPLGDASDEIAGNLAATRKASV